MLDLKDCLDQAIRPMILVVIGLALGMASLPVILFGVALVLATLLQISQGSAMLLTGLVVLVVSGLLAFLASSRVRLSLDSFRRSREELVRNISWVRTVLVHSGRRF
jgi:hypothetical protein